MFTPDPNSSYFPAIPLRFNSANANHNYMDIELYNTKNWIELIFCIFTCKYPLITFVNKQTLCCSVTFKGTKDSDIAYLSD
jgi:hypothetical protein